MSDVLAVMGPAKVPVSKVDLAALGFARRAATETGGAVDALLMGPSAAASAPELTGFGARTLYTAEHEDLNEATAEAYANVLSTFLERANAEGRSYRLVVAATSSTTREFFPRVAAQLDVAMASDVVALESIEPGQASLTRAVFVGNLLATVTLAGDCALVTCRPSEFPVAEPVGGEASVNAVELDGAFAHPRKRFVKQTKAESKRPDLKEADIVVSVGRGTRGPDEGIPLGEKLADILGAALGASRAVVDAGWVPNEFQVGQTGKIVAPKLYLAIGISGAIQHLAGMRNSKTIVAINKDAEAPIFEVADFGLVADLFEAVPEMCKLLEARKGA